MKSYPSLLCLFVVSCRFVSGNLDNFNEAITSLESNLEDCEPGVIQSVLTGEDDGGDCELFVTLNDGLEANNNDVSVAAFQLFDEGLSITAQDILECTGMNREEVVIDIFNGACNNLRISGIRRRVDEYGCDIITITDNLSSPLARASDPECLIERFQVVKNARTNLTFFVNDGVPDFDNEGSLDDFDSAVERLQTNIPNCQEGVIEAVLLEGGSGIGCEAFLILNDALAASNEQVDPATLAVFDQFVIIESQSNLDDIPKTREEAVNELFTGECNGNCVQTFSLNSRRVDDLGCEVRRIADDLSNQIGFVSDASCIEDRLQTTQFARGNLPFLVTDLCVQESVRINSNANILDAYNGTPSTEQVVVINNNTAAFFFDYSDQDSTGFQGACENNGGKYREIDFRATCTESNEEIVERLVVGALPRCYGKEQCANIKTHNVALFEELTLRATEELNSETRFPGTSWQCKGNLLTVDEEIRDAFCDGQIEALRDSPDVSEGFTSLMVNVNKPNVFLRLFTDDRDVGFADSANFRNVCERAGGLYIEQDVSLPCRRVRTTNNRLQESATFEATSFPFCLGMKCAASSTIPGLFEKNLMDIGELRNSGDTEWTCSGALGISFRTVGILGSLVVAWLQLL